MKKPTFKNDADAARFWETHEPMDYISDTTRVEPPRPPKSQAISLRLDPTILGLARRIARRKGIGYQTLLKMWITAAVSREIDRGVTEPAARMFLEWVATLPGVASPDNTFAPPDTSRYLSTPEIVEPSSAPQESEV